MEHNYDFSKAVYHSNNKICVICHKQDKYGNEHGEFWMTPSNLRHGCGCPKCKKEKLSELKSYTTEIFINKAKEIHGNKYDYSKAVYKGSNQKICIICPIHGEFYQIATQHLQGCGCPKCAGVTKSSTEGFIEKAISIHGNKYDYSKVEYINSTTKVKIICPIHGEFEQTPKNHLKGQGCPKCAIEYKSNKRKSTIEQFIEKARKIHGDKYDYSKVEYVNSKTKVCIICPIHGEFWQTANDHLQGYGCPICSKSKKLTTEEFIKKAEDIHDNIYDYFKVKYKGIHTKVCIICPIHGEFWQTPHSHLNGNGCPECARECNISENKLYEYLKDNYTFDIEKQKKFEWLNGKSLDIFIPKYNIAIEYQGIQHFKPIDYFGGEEAYKKQYKRDIDKYNECKEHNIHLLYFSKENEIPDDYIDSIYTKEENLLNRINRIINNN